MYYILYIYITIYLDTLKLYLDVPWHVGPLIIVYLLLCFNVQEDVLQQSFICFFLEGLFLFGQTVTLNMRFWDPAGFTADGSVENFQRRRQTELKHGRISMLATMGYITPE